MKPAKPDYDTTAFLMAGIALYQKGRLPALVAACARLSEVHGVALTCAPISDEFFSPDEVASDCVLGEVVAVATSEGGAPVAVDVEAARAALARVEALPAEIWTELAELAERRASPVSLQLCANGPLAGGGLVYGVLVQATPEEALRAAGEDPDDYGDTLEFVSYDWDLLTPEGAQEILSGTYIDQRAHGSAAAGVIVGLVRDWDMLDVDLGEEAHAARVASTAALAGEKGYWLVARFD